jgi:dolichol-phosphate mannosyltransferase
MQVSTELLRLRGLSVVIPAYNEEDSIEVCIQKVTRVLAQNQISHELIVVNDGSSDKTLAVCIELKKIYNFRLIQIHNNSGHMAAITAGLEASKGKFVATMDADLQDPPEDLVRMFQMISPRSKKEKCEIDVKALLVNNRPTTVKIIDSFVSLF